MIPVKIYQFQAVPLVLTLALAGCMDLETGYNLTGDVYGLEAEARPQADSRGVIDYPTYQVVVARNGDTVAAVASRIGLGADELARHNGLRSDQILRDGEILALPRKVAKGSGIDITTIATAAIDRAGDNGRTASTENVTEVEPVKHRVERGETAYSIARLYNVSVTALASWNGLGPDLEIRQGQHLLIPITQGTKTAAVDISKPGTGSTTPNPPSSKKALPKDTGQTKKPETPDLAKETSQTDDKFLRPVSGKIISDYSGKSGGNEGIDIAANAGTAVKAATNGEVALISRSVGDSTIVLLRHTGNIYTVYSGITDVTLKKGEKVQRGQIVGKVAKGDPSKLHFEVRRGTTSTDPKPYLN